MPCLPSPTQAGSNLPAAFRDFFKTMLQQVHNFKVDVIAGDANAAAYKYYEKQECQDLHNSSVAVMLREMQREVNTGHTSERRLHMDDSTNNDQTQLRAANGIYCYFMAIFPWRASGKRRTLEQSQTESFHEIS